MKQANKVASWFTTDQCSKRQQSPEVFSQSLKTYTTWKIPIYSLTCAQKSQETNVFPWHSRKQKDRDGNDQIRKRRNWEKNIFVHNGFLSWVTFFFFIRKWRFNVKFFQQTLVTYHERCLRRPDFEYSVSESPQTGQDLADCTLPWTICFRCW